MFDSEEKDEITVVTELLETDKKVSAVLLNELMQNGVRGIEDNTSRNIAGILSSRGIDINPHKIAEILKNNFMYGVQRFVGEYDMGSEYLANQVRDNVDVLLGPNGSNVAQGRYNDAMTKINGLSGRPSAWYDFVDRSIDNMASTIGAEYGSRAERAFIEFARFDERNNSRTSMHVMLESGLTEFLREARMATLNSDAVRDFNVAVSNVCNMHKQQEQSVTYSSNAAAFK
jgi:hypothetical protein